MLDFFYKHFFMLLCQYLFQISIFFNFEKPTRNKRFYSIFSITKSFSLSLSIYFWILVFINETWCLCCILFFTYFFWKIYHDEYWYQKESKILFHYTVFGWIEKPILVDKNCSKEFLAVHCTVFPTTSSTLLKGKNGKS